MTTEESNTIRVEEETFSRMKNTEQRPSQRLNRSTKITTQEDDDKDHDSETDETMEDIGTLSDSNDSTSKNDSVMITSTMKETLKKIRENKKHKVYGTIGSAPSIDKKSTNDDNGERNITTEGGERGNEVVNEDLTLDETNPDLNVEKNIIHDNDDGSLSTVACGMNEDDIFGMDLDDNGDASSDNNNDHGEKDENMEDHKEDSASSHMSCPTKNGTVQSEEENGEENEENMKSTKRDESEMTKDFEEENDTGNEPTSNEEQEDEDKNEEEQEEQDDDDEIVHDFTQNIDDQDVNDDEVSTKNQTVVENKRRSPRSSTRQRKAKDGSTDNGKKPTENENENENEAPIIDTSEQVFTDELLCEKIKEQFAACPDKAQITVKEFRIMLETNTGLTLSKEQKKLMKNQLTTLNDDDNDDDSEEESIPASDHKQSTPSKKKKKKRGKQSRKKTKVEGDKDVDSDADSDSPDTNTSPTTRSKTKPKGTRKPSHLKIHLEMRRKKQLAEAKIRAEELQAAREQKFNEEDQKRAQLIAQKFNTNTDEARIQRIEDRVGLLGRLKEKRMGVLFVNSANDNSTKSEKKGQNGLTIDIVQKDISKSLINLESSGESSNDEEDSDDELLIVGSNPSLCAVKKEQASTLSLKKKSPRSVLDVFKISEKSSSTQNRNIVAASFSNPRAALRNALRMKQYENGNKWLARELGYEKPEDHIRECKMIEMKKQKQIIAKEEHRLRQVNERNERLMAIVKGEAQPEEEQIGDDKDEEENQVRTLVNDDEESEKEEEEDEEIAMARAIESEQATSAQSDDEDKVNLEVTDDEEKDNLEVKIEVTMQNDGEIVVSKTKNKSDESDAEDLVHDYSEPLQTQTQTQDTNEDEIVHDATQKDNLGEVSKSENKNESAEKPSVDDIDFGNDDEAKDKKSEIENNAEEGDEKDTRPRNAAWRAMLEKEKRDIKRQKLLRKGQIDDEAEEEEEEEGVTGLEDFGFTVKSSNKEDDEGDNEADEDDLEHIVDEVSDGEGDEEAGDEARKQLQAKEEKMRHKEILRRIREGYDGKRGGVAGGSSKRGNLRFDQLVAADNKDDARRLGLLNDDELDSDDEEAKVNGEVEDEEVLIDKMLKDRYLNRPDLPEENFSDSEEESEDENDGDGEIDEEDEEDIEQERLAKRFSKRARMNRLIEIHGDDKEFSQSRLLDEDEDLRKELTKIKTVRGSNMRQVSSSSSSSFVGGKTSRQVSFSSSTSSSNLSFSNSEKENSLPMGTSSLSMAINCNIQKRKRKTSFLGSGRETNSRRRCHTQSSSGSTKAVSLGHVIFSGDTSANNGSSSMNSASSTILSRSSSLPQQPRKGSGKEYAKPNKKRSISDTGRKGASLWAKVSSTGFSKRRRG